MNCFKCFNVFQNAEELTDHLKNYHGLYAKNYFNCLKCDKVLTMSDFNDHLKTCKRISGDVSEAVLHGNTVDVDMTETDAFRGEAEVVLHDSTVDHNTVEYDPVGDDTEVDLQNNPVGIDMVENGPSGDEVEVVQYGNWASYETDSFGKNPKTVDVLKILQLSPEGNAFLKNYQNRKLHDHLRHELVKIILNETFSRDLVLSRYCLNDMAIQICKIFIGEKKDVYYHKIRNQQPKGYLYYKYTNMRHAQLEKDRKMTMVGELDFVEEECNDAIEMYEADSAAQCSLDDLEVSLKYIRDYKAESDKDLLLEHWKKTFEHRRRKILEYIDIDELFVDCPPLRTKNGHALLCIDFVLHYGVHVSNGLNNWDCFFDKNLSKIIRTVKDHSMKKLLNGLDATTSSGAKNKIIIMALHHLLVPSTRIINKENCKPTIPMSQQSFMRSVNGQHVMKSAMTKRNQFCKQYGMKNHPVIFEITTCMGTRYNVGIKDVNYEVGSLVEGVAVAYKIFKTLNIGFPLECEKVWKFIERIFYTDNVDDNVSGNLLSILSDLNNE